MNSASLHERNVRELQELAQQGAVRTRKKRSRSSRGASLHQIDVLSRWSAPGLALVTGASIYMAVMAGRAYPIRALAWGAILLAALWTCRRLLSAFRSGDRVSARPFRWRASYTSCISVLGVAFASAPILLAPAGAPAAYGLQILALSMLVSFIAALSHSAHIFTAAAFAVPATTFAVLTGLRAGDAGLALGCFAAAVLGAAGLFAINRRLEKTAHKRYPRTTLLRREVEPAGANISSPDAAENQALKA